MAKRETKETYREGRSERAETEREFDAAQGEAENRADVIGGNVSAMGTDLYSGYGNLSPIAAPEALTAPNISIERVSAPKQISTANLNQVMGRWREFADKPIDDASRERINTDTNTLRGYGNEVVGFDEGRMRGGGGYERLVTGGIDPVDAARMRGGGVYDEFAVTGGLSSADRGNIRARALSPIGSYATGTRDELQRIGALQSGYMPGFDAANRRLRRDTARAIADTSLSTELELKDRINQGRLLGAAGMAGTEGALQGLQSSNIATGAAGLSGTEQAVTQTKLADLQRRAAATGNSAQLEMQLADLTARYRAMGLSGEQAAAQAIADIEAQNVANTMSVNMFNAGNQNAANMANANNQMAAGRFNIENTMGINQVNSGLQLAGLGGQAGVYGTEVGREQAERDRALGILTGGAQANLGYLGQQSNLAVQPGIGGNIIGGIGAAAGAAGAAIPWFRRGAPVAA